MAKNLYPLLDPVRPASEMGFTDEQLAWLADIATPRCCHATGEHNPRHFLDKRYVCYDQLAEVAYRLREALELNDVPKDYGNYMERSVDPYVAVSRAGCPQCEQAANTGAATAS